MFGLGGLEVGLWWLYILLRVGVGLIQGGFAVCLCLGWRWGCARLGVAQGWLRVDLGWLDFRWA